eukprot:1855726-Amphidinium_carterae.2
MKESRFQHMYTREAASSNGYVIILLARGGRTSDTTLFIQTQHGTRGPPHSHRANLHSAHPYR